MSDAPMTDSPDFDLYWQLFDWDEFNSSFTFSPLHLPTAETVPYVASLLIKTLVLLLLSGRTSTRTGRGGSGW